MEEVGLIESSYLRDSLQLDFLKKCAYYKPIQLREVDDEAEFQRLKKDGFCRFAVCYKRTDRQYLFHKMDPAPQIRFVELLASLTLYHFSKASKKVYYQCLDLRGLEFCSTKVHGTYERRQKTPVDLNGFEGMRRGRVTDVRFNEFAIYYGFCHAVVSTYLDETKKLPVLKRFKTLSLSCFHSSYHFSMMQACSQLISPDVENVFIFTAFCLDDKAAELAQFLDFCTQVKTLSIRDFGIYDSPFAQIFKFEYSAHKFQLQNHRLVRCVRVGDEWFWTDKCDMDTTAYHGYLGLYESQDYLYDEHIYSHDFERHLNQVLPYYSARRSEISGKQTIDRQTDKGTRIWRSMDIRDLSIRGLDSYWI